MLKFVPIGSTTPAFAFSGWGWQTATAQFAGLPFWDGYQGRALINLIFPKL